MIRIPLRTINPLNVREHWRVRAKRVRMERALTAVHLSGHDKPAFPVVVNLSRESVRTMDTDGLAASFKGVRDQIAEWLGVDDADPRIEWRYAQRKAGDFGVCIEFQQVEVMA